MPSRRGFQPRTVSSINSNASVSTGLRSYRRQPAAGGNGNKPIPKPTTLTKFIKNVASGLSETKRVIYYSPIVAGTGAIGNYAGWQYQDYNQLITSNVNDLMRLIPQIQQGTGDNQRIGNDIVPVSHQIRGSVKCTLLDTSINFTETNIVAVIYVLQHQQLKDYVNLGIRNDFNQMLETGENTTVVFDGSVRNAQLPVANQYYKLLKKKVIPLRYGGFQGNIVGQAPGNSVNTNTQTFFKEFKINLSKKIPKKLKYSESNAPAAGLYDPINSSVFMCCGFYQMDGTNSTQGGVRLQIQYQSELKYKDS